MLENVQFSGGKGQLNPEPMAQLRRRLERRIKPDQDRVRLWSRSARSCARIANLGINVPAPGFADIVIGARTPCLG